jgi:hypothetical protein
MLVVCSAGHPLGRKTHLSYHLPESHQIQQIDIDRNPINTIILEFTDYIFLFYISK